jgi:ATP-binding cassette subfamily B protein
MDAQFLINKHLNAAQAERIRSFGSEEDPVLFALVGDINANGQYSETTVAFTRSQLVVFETAKEGQEQRICYDDIEDIFAKRMYGNALIRVRIKGESKPQNIFRYTFGIAALCDAAIRFVKGIKDGEKVDSLKESVSLAYEKQLSVCPKCGRTLSSPGVKCINCESKRKIISRLAVYMKPDFWNIVLSVAISIATTCLMLVPPYLTRSLVDVVLKDIGGVFPEDSTRMLINICILLATIQFIRHALGAWRAYVMRKCSTGIVRRLRDDVYKHAQYLPMSFYDKTSTGSVINRISGDSSTLQAFMLRITQDAVVEFFRMMGIIIIMLIMSPRLALYSLLPVPFVVIGSRIFSKKIAPYYRRIWRKWTAVSSVLTDTIPGIRVIKSFTNEKNATDLFEKSNAEWYDTNLKAGRILSVYPSAVNLFIGFGSVIIWALGGFAVLSGGHSGVGEITAGLLVSFISYAAMFYEPVNFFATLNDSFQNALSSAERIFDILDAEPEANFGKGNIPEHPFKGKIEFKNVSFSFDRSKKVLKNINITIEPGDIVGIVGTTGSGKSTLVNLFMRYYDNYQGRILVDGKDIRKIDMEYFRSQIGYVQQEPMMFHDTIFNNIAYGNSKFTVEDVIYAADIANAHQFIVRQPDGYDSVLGERGVGLSGGERQRVSIARAVLKNPSILVFDEATASVDSETEHLIQESIEHLIMGRTTIMIAHRLSTLSKANKIIVVDNGSILECGTPEELLAKKGKYYKLCRFSPWRIS